MLRNSLVSLDANFLAKIGKILSFELMAVLWADFMASSSGLGLEEEDPWKKDSQLNCEGSIVA